MSNALIRETFEGLLKTWADAQTPAIPIAFEGVQFTPPSTRYLRAFLIPNTTQSDDLGRVHRRYEGFFQVTQVLPIGYGASQAQAMQAAIVALYPTTTPFLNGSLSIWATQPMSASVAIQEPGRYVVTLLLPYRADTY